MDLNYLDKRSFQRDYNLFGEKLFNENVFNMLVRRFPLV